MLVAKRSAAPVARRLGAHARALASSSSAAAAADAAAKRDFGSFHSSNVEELLRLPASEYVAPPLPEGLPRPPTDVPAFGRPMRDAHFLLEQETCFLNHGAFGACLADALDAVHHWQKFVERQPLRFLDRQLLPHLVGVTRRLASLLGVPPTELVLVENATTGFNAVVAAAASAGALSKPRARVLTTSLTYGSLKKLLAAEAARHGAELDVVELSIADGSLSSPAAVLAAVEAALTPDTTLAVFDHVASNAAVVLPVKELTALCASRGIPVFIDGAHGLGAFDLDLADLGADWYTGNAHKWFCAPKGTAFLHAKPQHHAHLRPPLVSHGYGAGLASEWAWQGLRDYSPLLAMHTALDWWHAVGPERIRAHMRSTVRTAAEELAAAWGVEAWPCGKELHSGPMVLVPLPPSCDRLDGTPATYSDAEAIQVISSTLLPVAKDGSCNRTLLSQCGCSAIFFVCRIVCSTKASRCPSRPSKASFMCGYRRMSTTKLATIISCVTVCSICETPGTLIV